MRFDASSVLREKSELFIVLFVALAVRLLFVTGPFGSDDLTYIDSAVRILSGDWSASTYIGATRYGVNLPVAGFMWLFGVNEISAIAWPLVASLIQVAIVTHLGAALWGRRAGLFAGLLLAFLPLDVNLAGRAMADTPLAMLITASFYLFYQAEQTGKTWLYWVTGFAIGAVFWIKESVVTFSLVFLLFPLIWRRWDMRWLYIMVGGAIAVFANLLLFKVLTGDFLYITSVIELAADRTIGVDAIKERSVGFYFNYLFADMRHTLFLGYLAVFGAIAVVIKKRPSPASASDMTGNFILVWGGGLIFLYTFFVVSLAPFQLVMKQTNYMLIFVGPLCLLGGYFISGLAGRTAALVILVYGIGGVLLSGMEQQAIRNFTSNSKATLAFAISRPEAVVFAGLNAMNLNAYYAIVDPDRAAPQNRLRPIKDAQCNDDARTTSRYVVIDNETKDWSDSMQDITQAQARLAGCWREELVLTPAGFGLGRNIVLMTAQAAALVPGQLGERLSAKISSYATPLPAIVYAFGK